MYARALMRFGTASMLPLQRTAARARRATLPRAPRRQTSTGAVLWSQPCCHSACRLTNIHATPLQVPDYLLLQDEPVSVFSARCYYPQDLRRTGLHTHSRMCFAAPHAPAYCAVRQGHRAAGSAIHFRHAHVRQVRCNALLAGCQPPWPPPCCLHVRHTFVSCARPLSPSGVQPPLQHVLTTCCPLVRLRYAARSPRRLRLRSLLTSQHPLYSTLLHSHCCPARHFGGNQLPDSSFGLSPLCACPAIELNIRIAQALQPRFRGPQPAHT